MANITLTPSATGSRITLHGGVVGPRGPIGPQGPQGLQGPAGAPGSGGSNARSFVYGEQLTAGTPVRVEDSGGIAKVFSLASKFETGAMTVSAAGSFTNRASCQITEKIFAEAYNESGTNKVRLANFTGGPTPTYGTPITIDASLDTIVGIQANHIRDKVVVFADNNQYQLFFINYLLTGEVTISTDDQVYTLPDRLAGSGLLATDDAKPDRVFPLGHAVYDFTVLYINEDNQLAYQIIDFKVNDAPVTTSIGVSGGVNNNVITTNLPTFVNVKKVSANRIVIMWGDSTDDKVKAIMGEYDSISERIRLQKAVGWPWVIYDGAATNCSYLPITDNSLNDGEGVFVYVKDGGGIEAVKAKITNSYKILPDSTRYTIEENTGFNGGIDCQRVHENAAWTSNYGVITATSSTQLKTYMVSIVEGVIKVHAVATNTGTYDPTGGPNYLFRAGEEDYAIHPRATEWIYWTPRVTEYSKEDYVGIAQADGNAGTTHEVSTGGGQSTVHTGLTTGANVFINSLGALTNTITRVRAGRALDTHTLMVDYPHGQVPDNVVTVGFGDGFKYKLSTKAKNNQVKINQALKEIALLGGGTVKLGPGRIVINAPILMLGSHVALRGSGMNVTEIFLADHMDQDGIVGGDGFGDYLDMGEDSGVFSITDNQIVSDLKIEGNCYRQSDSAAYQQKQSSGQLSVGSTRNLLRLRMDSQNSYGGICERVMFMNGIQNGISIESVLHYNVRDCWAYNCVFNYYQEFVSQTNITNCHSQHARSSGFQAFASGETVYTNCISRSDDGKAFSHNQGRANTYIGCLAHRPGWHADVKNVSSKGFEFSGCDGDKMIGCSVFAAQGTGVSISGSSNCEFIANSFARNGQLTDLVDNDFVILGSGNNYNTFIGNTFDNTPAAFYSNRARFNFNATVSGGNLNNTFVGNKPGPAALGFMTGFPENDSDDNTRQIYHGDTYLGGKVRIEAPTGASKLHIRSKDDGSEATIQRTEVNAEFSIKNKVAGPAATPYSVVFDDTNKYINIPHHADFDLRNTDFTFSFWVKLDNNTNVNRMLGKSGSYRMDIFGGNLMRWSIDEAGQASINTNDPSGYAIPVNTWTHVAIKRNISTGAYTFYANGVTRGSFTPAKDLVNVTTPLNITASDNCMAGKMDDFRLYRRLLTDSEINTTLASGGDPDPTGLVMELPFNEGTGTLVRDLTGNGHHGTLINGPTFSTDVPSTLPGQTRDDTEITIVKSVDGPAVGIDGTNTFGAPTGRTELAGVIVVNNAPATPLTTKTANYTATAADHTIVVDATAGAVTITLPTAVGIKGRTYTIKKIDNANNVVIDGNGSQTIDGSTTKTLTTQYQTVTVQSDNANWFVIAN